MKIKITKEKEGVYFAELTGLDGVYAQGETAEESIKNLYYVYNMVQDFDKEQTNKKIIKQKNKMKNFNKHKNLLNSIGFKKIEFSI